MPPFLTGKATHRQEAGRLRKFEKEGERQIARELDRLRKRLMRGITADNVHEIERRLNDPEIVGPLADTLDRLVSEWAQAGADIGRRQIEKEVFGVRR